MDLQAFIKKLDEAGELVRISEPVSKRLEAAAILKELDGKPVLIEQVKESGFPLAGNIFSTKTLIAKYFGIKEEALIPKMINALDQPSKPEVIENPPCQEVEMKGVDLDKLPILFHTEKDGGNYISSAIFVAHDPEHGNNVSFHRGMQIAKDKFVLRILQRDLNTFLERTGELKVACCIGNPVNVLLAAATSIPLGKFELEMANTLKAFPLAKAKLSDALVPAHSEFVLEGTIRKEELHAEGPFVDLTETLDVVRQQPVFTVEKITHRKNAVYQALLPGCLEHKLLMGMPREPTIYKAVNAVGVKCLDVSITPGGASWLHAAVKIKKEKEEDGRKAIEAAFKGHSSLKHAFIVDDDIDILDPLEVEWAMATRFQADKDFVLKANEKGSSLDPSADPNTRATAKAGFDLTKPLVVKGKNFGKVPYPKVDLHKYLK